MAGLTRTTSRAGPLIRAASQLETTGAAVDVACGLRGTAVPVGASEPRGKWELRLPAFAAMGDVDKDAVEAVIRRRFPKQRVGGFWIAESAALGGLTPAEAFAAGYRLEVMELALGQPGNPDPSVPLISPAQAGAVSQVPERGVEVRRSVRR